MTHSDDRKNLDFAGGQVHALISFLNALIETHPNPDVLAKRFERISQVALALVEGTLVSDEFLDGRQNVTDRLKLALERAQVQQESRRKDRDLSS
jgi:hypothetical protein